MVACRAIASAFCVFASLADAVDIDIDEIPVSADYSFQARGEACVGTHLNGPHGAGMHVDSWGACQSACDSDEKCTQFTVYSRTIDCPRRETSLPVCFMCQLDASCEHKEATKDTGAAMFTKNVPAYPPKIGRSLLRQHNIYRCMNNLPPLEWSYALADEASTWSEDSWKKYGPTHLEKEYPPPTNVGGFPQVEQNVHVIERNQETGTKLWWDLTQGVDTWYNDKTDSSPIMNRNTIYVGCGGYHTGSEDNGVVTLVCNYGAMGAEAEFTTLSSDKAAKKTAGQCALEIDSMNQFQQVLDNTKALVTIAYTPKSPVWPGLSTSDPTTCNIKEYRLILDGQLKLVPMDGDTDMPCKESGVDGSLMHGWAHDTKGMWNKGTSPKDCLMIGDGHKLTTDSGENTCTRNNLFFEDPLGAPSGGWHFSQQGSLPPANYPDWCMPEIDAANDLNPQAILDLPVKAATTGGEGCSAKWNVKFFDATLVTATTTVNLEDMKVVKGSSDAISCPVCRRKKDNFACALPGSAQDDKFCMLAPTEIDCLAQGGQWCGPVDWKIQGSCGHPLHRCDGAVDPLQQPSQAGCVQLGGVYKTDYSTCALIADGEYTEEDCRNSLKEYNSYEEQDVTDCVNLVKQTQDKAANVFDTVHGYIYDDPAHPKYCRLWYCSKLSDDPDSIPHQDGDQAWLIAYKTKNTKNSLSIMV